MSKADLTKRALSEAFSELLKEKPFEQITVTDITRKAGVNRQTFYYHFRDLYDLIAFSVKQHIHAILPDMDSTTDWELDLVTVLNALREERDSVYKLGHSIDPGYAKRFMREHVSGLVSSFITKMQPEAHLTQEDRRLIAQFFGAGLIDILDSWVDEGMLEPPEHLVRRLSLFLADSIDTAVRRIAEARSAPLT
ncbi:MAG: TetR/AcrR family transcriptional regulator C-terminal domain-containing protein [Atopobiaceae bacterium]|nr:TetR/AcrR family transcriptional regulator C-terminal domain-containing protein [Atopobiaceae bacterium]MBR1829997.1 TetR/AcrR family transcriptional regulator C-terminal domain-containing protein [Atopobiaceae bacterium]